MKQSESITNIWHAIIGEDTGLPVFEREDDFLLKMADWINQPEITGINLLGRALKMEGAIQVAIFRSHYLAYFVKNEGV